MLGEAAVGLLQTTLSHISADPRAASQPDAGAFGSHILAQLGMQGTRSSTAVASWAGVLAVLGVLSYIWASDWASAMPGVSAVTGVTMATAVLVRQFGGNGASNIFAWHIAFMALAWSGFASSGAWAYKLSGAASPGGKGWARGVHVVCMLLAVVLSIAGYVCIYLAHAANGEGQFGGLYFSGGLPRLSRSFARFAHALIGYLVLTGAAAQAPAGLWKRHLLESSGERSFTWHGWFGRYLLSGALAATLIGVWIEFSDTGWSVQLKIALSASLLLLLRAAWHERTPGADAKARAP